MHATETKTHEPGNRFASNLSAVLPLPIVLVMREAGSLIEGTSPDADVFGLKK